MKEITDLVSKAEKFLKTAEAALELGDYDSCASRC
ncbi:HEPN domain-containing protein [Candidatus Bipolaricaulota bacterium]|nr:HEPN domain-containing protein [Candidatus Bipolaricaulota bacterium]